MLFVMNDQKSLLELRSGVQGCDIDTLLVQLPSEFAYLLRLINRNWHLHIRALIVPGGARIRGRRQ